MFRYFSIIRYELLLILILILILLQPKAQAEQDTNNYFDMSLEELSKIKVYTFKGSLSKAVNIKRLSNTITDTIIAEDIGKMPDRNVAEALQRLTGLSIARDNGEGTSVTIRGIADNLNLTLLNGQVMTSPGSGRGIDFSSMPSSIISAIEVYKTPTAKQIEGSIGGTINLITARPLDIGEEKGSTFIELTKSENNSTTPSFSFSYNSLLSDTFGVAVALSHEQLDNRTDALKNLSWSDSSSGFYPTRWVVGTSARERNRNGIMLNSQWQPNDKINNFLDVNYSKVSDNVLNSNFESWIPGGFSAIYPNSIITNSATNTMVEFAVDQLYISPTLTNVQADVNSLNVQLGSEIEFGNVFVSGAIGYSESETQQLGQEIYYFDHWSFNDDKHDALFRQVGGRQYAYLEYELGTEGEFYDPSVQFNHPNDSYIEGGANNNINRLSQGPVIRAPIENSDNDSSIRLDLKYNYQSIKMLDSIESGIRWNKREKQTLSTRQHLGPWEIAVNNSTLWGKAPLFHDLLTTPYSPSNFMSGNSAQGVPTMWNATLNFNDAITAYTNHLNQGFGLTNGGNGPYFTDFDSIFNVVGNTPDRRNAVNNIEESIAFYLQANVVLLNGKLKGNFGVRFVQTDLTSHALSGSAFAATSGGELSAISIKNDYNNSLPSLNLNYQLSDTTNLRFSAAKVMARPNFNQAKAGANTATDGWYEIGVDGYADPANNIFADEDSFVGGNVNLKPYTANQFDLSYEWYLDHNGIFSVGFFYKDIISFIFNDVQIGHILVPGYETESGSREPYATLADIADGEVRHTDNNGNITDANGNAIVVEYPLLFETVQFPVNGNGGFIKGLEFSFQSNLYFIEGWENFGVVLNYTFSDSSADYFKASFDEVNIDLPFQFLSEHTSNLTGYYEDDTLMVRVSYNWRSESLENPAQEVDGMALWRDSYGQLDASFSYSLSDQFKFTASVSNLLEESSQIFSAHRSDGNLLKSNSVPTDRNYNQSYNGRIIRIGLSFSF